MSLQLPFLFSYLKLPSISTGQIVEKLEAISADDWFFDSYRTCYMFPVYTEGGGGGKKGSLNFGRTAFDWTEYAPQELKEYLMEFILPWMSPMGRVMILKTPPGGSSAPHIDCRKDDFESYQPKLRIVLQGDVDSLRFITRDGVVRPSSNQLGVPFLMDGRWPHEMRNNSERNKYTVCIGTPWRGEGLSPAGLAGDGSGIKTDDLTLPADYFKYFEDLEVRKRKFED